MGIIFDPASKRIILDSANVTASELYSRSCDWLAISDNMKYSAVFRQSGMDALPGGRFSPGNFFLQGSWRVRPMEASHTLDIDGNLYVEDGVSDPVVPTLGSYNVLVRYTVSVQAQGIATSGSVGPSAGDIASAVLAALNATTIPVDMQKTNGVEIVGDGTSGDKFRSVLYVG